MTDTTHLLHPGHCFCQVPDTELRPWAIKRFVDHCSTVDLLTSTDDPHQKELISIVALLDVDDDTMLEMMGNVDLPQHHILHCRQNVKQMLGIKDNPE